MKHGLLYTVGLITVSMVAFATSHAYAQTAASGPYYATPAWDQQLPASTRFSVLPNWGGAAVLDRETGLVWEQSPTPDTFAWVDAQSRCNELTKGGRSGWRLPTIQDLASLVDPSVAPPGPTLPSGHPFLDVQSSIAYWSANTVAANTNNAWFVGFFISGAVASTAKSNGLFVWCVRGGQGVDSQ